mgnify:CR=1 FL=1
MICCVFPDCLAPVYGLTGPFCLVHIEFLKTTSRPRICSLSNCNGVCKHHGRGTFCCKHNGDSNTCCYPYCTSPGIDEYQMCVKHCVSYTCTLPECIIPIKDEGLLCAKHDCSTSLCCAIGCTHESISPSNYCLFHHKEYRFCSIDNCFRRVHNKKSLFCKQHLSNPNTCVLPRCSKPVVDYSLCAVHYSVCFNDGIPDSFISDEIYNDMMNGSILFDGIDIDLVNGNDELLFPLIKEVPILPNPDGADFSNV